MRILITGTAVPEAGDAIIGNFRNFLDAPHVREQIIKGRGWTGCHNQQLYE